MGLLSMGLLSKCAKLFSTIDSLILHRKFCAYHTSSPLPWDFITVLRIIFATSEEIAENKHRRVFDDEVVSVENELSVCNFLIEICKDKLTEYSTTQVCLVPQSLVKADVNIAIYNPKRLIHLQEEDEHILQNSGLGGIERLAVTMRKEEKKLVNHVIIYARTQIHMLKRYEINIHNYFIS